MAAPIDDGSGPLTPDLAAKLASAVAGMALKDQGRTGWTMHGVATAETVAAHSWGTAYLCLLFAEAAGVNLERALAIAVVHDLAEAKTGDIASRAAASDRSVSQADKAVLEAAAIAELLPAEDTALTQLWRSYEDRSDEAAVFVRDMNLLDMCLQALVYERGERYDHTVYIPSAGGHRHLDEFFLGALPRLTSPLARRLYQAVWRDYVTARNVRNPTGALPQP